MNREPPDFFHQGHALSPPEVFFWKSQIDFLMHWIAFFHVSGNVVIFEKIQKKFAPIQNFLFLLFFKNDLHHLKGKKIGGGGGQVLFTTQVPASDFKRKKILMVGPKNVLYYFNAS